MTETSRSGFLPWWVWAIVLMEAIVPTVFGIATWFDPATYIEGATSATYEIVLYITRNLTTALGIVLALLMRSHHAVLALVLVRMTTDISDMINATFNGGGESVVQAIPFLFVLLIILPSIAVWYLVRRVRSSG